MEVKKILPIEINFELKNFFEKFKKRTIKNFSKNKKIIFCDAASYNNLGDQAISYAISLLIRDKFSDYEYIEITEKDFLRNFKYLRKHIKEDDIICLSGGGNMGNLYPRYEAIRRKVIKSFKNNKIVIFPQTIDYENDKYGKYEKERSKKIYNYNNNLLVCAREIKSYKNMSEMYNNVILVPDIVFYLYNNKEIVPQNNNKNDIMRIGICLREDRESTLKNNERQEIMNSLENEKYQLVKLTTMSNANYINYENRPKELWQKLKEFSDCDFIITDRLHGMIFSILCNKPCIVFDNTNKKVSGVLETVKDYFFDVYFFKKWSIEKFRQVVNIKNKNNIFDKEKAYDKLTKSIRKIGGNI